MKTLSTHRPRPSIEMRTPAAVSVPVKAALVNWLPWSVLKMSGVPKRASASSSALTQNDTSIVLERRHVSTPERVEGPARPVHDGDEVEEPAPERDIGDVGCPYLVRPVDHHIAQQVRENLVTRRRLARPRLRPQGGDAHPAHQPPYPLAVDRLALRPQQRRHPSRAEERPSQEQLVNPPHQREILGTGRRRWAIDARARDPEQLALSPDREPSLRTIDEPTTPELVEGPERSSSGSPG